MASIDFPDLDFVPEIDEDFLDEVDFDEMVSAAENIRSLADQMVKLSPSNMKELNVMGAKLSSEYDTLSLASVKAVQRNIDNDASKVVKSSVLQLGQQCLQLIRELCDENRNGANAEKISNNFENQVLIQVDVVLNALQLLQDTSQFHNVYWKFIEALENIFNAINLPSSKSQSNIEDIGVNTEETIGEITKESRNLYNLIKMVILNLVSPDEEKIATLKHLLQSVGTLQKLLTRYLTNSDEPSLKKSLVSSSESLLSLLIDLLITCNEAEDSITSQHTKAILKAAVKDVLLNLQSILELLVVKKCSSKYSKAEEQQNSENTQSQETSEELIY